VTRTLRKVLEFAGLCCQEENPYQSTLSEFPRMKSGLSRDAGIFLHTQAAGRSVSDQVDTLQLPLPPSPLPGIAALSISLS
jgi:hypothetical protein